MEGYPRTSRHLPNSTLKHTTDATQTTEEFAIYLNYVRKLTFDETPDYDFLRELFSTALKNSGADDDQVYDWMLLNGGKGWELNGVSRRPVLSAVT